MHAAVFLPILLSWWCSSVAALTFDPDFNGTIPSIPGITNFSYPSGSGFIESGFADGIVSTNIHQPWPYERFGNRNVYLVRYCYADQASKDALYCSLTAAMNLWLDALGGRPSAELGYNLHFLQTYIQGQAQFCYADGT